MCATPLIHLSHGDRFHIWFENLREPPCMHAALVFVCSFPVKSHPTQ